MDKDLYNKQYMEKLNIKRDKLLLNNLLINIQEEESKAIKFFTEENCKRFRDILKPLTVGLIFSKTQCYKTFSAMSIIASFDRKTKFKVLDLSMVLDVWFNTTTIMDKFSILSPDILIIHGRCLLKSAEFRVEALLDIISIRKTEHKTTWMFIEGDSNIFKETYAEIIPRCDVILDFSNIEKSSKEKEILNDEEEVMFGN